MRLLKKLCAILVPFLTLAPLEISLAAQTTTRTYRIESIQGRDVIAGEILVRFRDGTGIQPQVLAAQDADLASVEPVGRNGAIRLRSLNRDTASLLQTYGNRLDVLYAEPNYIWRASDIPNDLYFTQQWALRNTGQPIEGTTGTSGADIKAAQAWDITEGSRGIVVGVVDSGVDYNHPDLAANMWSAPASFTVNIGGQAITCAAGTHGFNAITRTCDPMDDSGHGTHVAGIIAGSGNNGYGISGVSRVGSLMGLKFLDASGAGTTTDAIAAIEFAIQVKALFPATANIRVLNNSWGATFESRALRDEISLTQASDMLFVAAAGNDGQTNDLVKQYPASYDLPTIISVAATDNTGALSFFSNWGTTTVHLGAPGVDVLSTLPSGTYAFESGTSVAAPMVSGAAALVLSACTLPTSGLRANLLNAVDLAPTLAGRTTTGGRLNVYRALSSCAGTPSPAFRLAVIPGTQTMEVNGSSNLALTVTSVNGFGGTISLSATGMPAGITAAFEPSSLTGSGGSTLVLTTGSNVAAGSYFIRVDGTSGAQTFSTGVVLTVGVSVALRQTLLGSLAASDQSSTQDPGRYADFYRFMASSSTDVIIDLKSRAFDTTLRLLSSGGSTLVSSTDEGGEGNSRITTTLSPGAYSIEVTSANVGSVGNYSLSINTPTLVSPSVLIGAPGDSLNVALTGTRFASPFTLDGGAGVTPNNFVVLSPTSATATLAIAANAAASPRALTVTTNEGTSNPLTLWIPPAIALGQRILGTLSPADAGSLIVPHHFADLFRLTLASSTEVSVDLRSTDFPPYLRVLSAAGTLQYFAGSVGGDEDVRISATLAAGTYYVEVTSTVDEAVGAYDLSINLPVLTSISPAFIAAGRTTNVVLTGDRLTTPMSIATSADITPEGVLVQSTTTTSVNLTVSGNATPGTRSLVATTAAGASNTRNFKVFPQIPDLVSTQSGTLSTGDVLASGLLESYEDVYRLFINITTVLDIQLRSTDFSASLSLLSLVGEELAVNEEIDSSGMVRLAGVLGAGTYFVRVSSSSPRALGNYTLTRATTPLIVAGRNFGVAGTVVDVAFVTAGSSGTGFAAIPGISISDVQSIPLQGSLRLVTAKFSIAANATPGPRSVVFFNSNPVTFTVFSSAVAIRPGQTVNGTLSTSDVLAPDRTDAYSDLYEITLTSPETVVIELESDAFDSYLEIPPTLFTDAISDDDSGGNLNAFIRTPLGIGTHYLLVTSANSGIGNYTLTLHGPPTVTLITPNRAARGTTVGITLTGTAFVSPMTVVPDTGISVSNLTVLNSTTAIATLTVAADASISTHTLRVNTLYGVSAAVTFDVVAPQASQLNFPRLLSPAELAVTGLALTNPSSTNANVSFTLYNASGGVLNNVNVTVPAREQFVRLGNEIFTSASEAGWIKATSDTAGLQSFWLGGNFSSFMDGAAAAPAARDLVFSLVTSRTDISVANAGSGANTVVFRIYGSDGTELAAAVTRNIATNGIFATSAASLFPSVSLDSNIVSIRATGTLDIAGTSVTTDFPIGPSWAVVNGVDASLSLFELNFAHVPTGPDAGWLSVLGITNLSTSAQTLTMTFTPVSGSPVQVTRSIAAGATLRESAHTLFSFTAAYQEGWVRVTGTGPLNGFLAYGFTGTNGTAVVPGQGLAQSNLIFSHVAMGPGWGTGLALLNATSTPANVQVYIMRKNGTLVGGADNVPTAAFTLPAGAKVAKLLEELVPAANANDGFVYVRTTNNVPLYGLELFFTRDVQVIANVAAGVVDPSITYTPPAP